MLIHIAALFVMGLWILCVLVSIIVFRQVYGSNIKEALEKFVDSKALQIQSKNNRSKTD